MNVFEAITQRRSFRGEFQDRPIDETDIHRLIEAARWTPSPFNVQPWELIIIQGSEGKELLAKMTEKAVVKQFKNSKFLEDNSLWMCTSKTEWQTRRDGVLLTDHVTLPKLLQNCPEKLTGGILKNLLKNVKSLSIIGHLGIGKIPAKEIASQMRDAPLLMLITMNNERRPPGEGATRWMWLSMGMLIQNILLTATSIGVGVQLVSAPLESEKDRDEVRNLFNIPNSHEVITLLRMGYYITEEGGSVRLKPTDFVHYENVGE